MEDLRHRRGRYFPIKSLCGKYASVGEWRMGRDGEGRESELDGKGQDGIERDGAGGRGAGRDR